MAIPSGSGTEVLKSKYTSGISTTWTTIGEFNQTNHIYTVLSIIFCNNNADAEEMNFALTDDESNTNEHFLLLGHSIAAKATYIWNDKFVVSGSGTYKYLRCNFNTSANIDVTVSYIEQDWST
tara:strand:- start:2058 stop:2426 length:369 start_codon:yes stop_codon:yes gene_type:complete